MNSDDRDLVDSLQAQASRAKSMTARGAIACVGGMVMMGVGFAASRGRASSVDWLLIIGGVGALVIGLALLIRYGNQAEQIRERMLEQLFRSKGWPRVKATKKTRQQGWAPFALAKHVPSGARGLSWFATGNTDGVSVSVAEHRYVVSTGKSTHVVYHTLAACAVPAGWPVVSLRPESFIDKIAERFGKHDIRVESDAFNSRWRVQSDDENFAVLLLSPELQSHLESHAPQDRWIIGGGWIVRTRTKRLDPDDLRDFIDGVAALRACIPRELDAWG